jgi:hypothetical protein
MRAESMPANQYYNNRPKRQIYGKSNRSKFKPWRSLTRMVVGGAILGIEELMDRLEIWEQEIDEDPVEAVPAEMVVYDVVDESTIAETSVFEPQLDSSNTRHVLVGLIFDSQAKLEKRITALRRFERRTSRRLLAPFEPLNKSKLGRNFSSHFDNLVRRGESEIARLAEIGKVEEYRSKKLALTATTETVDDSIDYLTDNEELQELITMQGVGIAGEALEEVRERTVSADDFFEGVVRAFLRRTPRKELEAPSREVRLRSVHVRPPEDEE